MPKPTEHLHRSLQWMVAAAAASALAFTVVGAPWSRATSRRSPTLEAGPSTSLGAGVGEAAAGVCDANPKAANFSFTLNDMAGKAVKLADYKGKVIVLDFWATWCGPCKIEIPWFVDFQNKYGRQGLSVLGVVVEDTVDKLKPFADQYKMNYPILIGIDRDDVTDAYGPIWGLPTTLLIGRDGKICKKHAGLISKDSFEKTIKALLSS
ncbi:MAG: TlpA family protein disulfide reductase [Acidobacteria bacterium]|nr:TlpA family protein disulfide reductase [Acidobacteriota bacterium]